MIDLDDGLSILFTRHNLERIVAEEKTMTRRAEKKQPGPGATFLDFDAVGRATFSDGTIWPARYGQPGGLLWCREGFTWSRSPHDVGQGIASFDWGDPREVWAPGMGAGTEHWPRQANRRSPIHMWRWAARFHLRVLTIGVERLQDISEADALAEGVRIDERSVSRYAGEARDLFHVLWDQINAVRKFAWETNPWVWVVGFQYIKPEVARAN